MQSSDQYVIAQHESSWRACEVRAEQGPSRRVATRIPETHFVPRAAFNHLMWRGCRRALPPPSTVPHCHGEIWAVISSSQHLTELLICNTWTESCACDSHTSLPCFFCVSNVKEQKLVSETHILEITTIIGDKFNPRQFVTDVLYTGNVKPTAMHKQYCHVIWAYCMSRYMFS